jgi:hypothetical protein
MRHINSVNFGYLRGRFARDGFAKNLGIHDFYAGDSAPDAPSGPLGGIQSLPAPPEGVVRTQVPWPLPVLAERFLARAAGLLTIGEDQPRRENHVALDPARQDAAGLPGLRITHRYTARDLAVDRALRRRARRILRAAGALFCYHRPIRTFSHALGTVRMGHDERSAPLDAQGRFRGLDNLRVVDASTFPTAAAVNPSLTIAANALRIVAALVAERPAHAGAARG